MGYRFGEHRYSEGRYSRWPDEWHDKACTFGDEEWKEKVCETPVFTPAPPPASPWYPTAPHPPAWGVAPPPKPPWYPVS